MNTTLVGQVALLILGKSYPGTGHIVPGKWINVIPIKSHESGVEILIIV
jgi:hypothetical protein